jgi:hypothetical protein
MIFRCVRCRFEATQQIRSYKYAINIVHSIEIEEINEGYTLELHTCHLQSFTAALLTGSEKIVEFNANHLEKKNGRQ